VWKDTLLQLLIVLLPVFMFMVWNDRPERTRHAHTFLGVVCGISMLLSMQFTIVNEYGASFDFRHIPLLIGSLYGGVPAAVLLTALYAGLRIPDLHEVWQIIIFALYLMIFVPYLLTRISIFQKSNRPSRMKIACRLSLILLFIYAIVNLITIFDLNKQNIPQYYIPVIIYGLTFLIVAVLAFHYTELAYERVELQIQLRDVSLKYRNEMRRLQQLIDNTPLIVVFLDNNGGVTHVNDMVLKLVYPIGRKDLLNNNFSYVAGLMDIQADSDPVERVLQGEERVTEMLRIDGRTFYTVTCPVKELPSQGAEGILFVGQDITELQRLKDEVDRMERLSLVGQMAASITHEIRNPMAVIRGFVQLLNERSPKENESYFRIVLDELDRANAIINDFLSLAQNRIVEKEPCSLHDLLNDLVPLIWADANMRGQMVELQLSENIDRLEMNTKEIKQLILNLARNGMEAMDDKGVLRIETLNLADRVQMRVTDNGVGIPQEKLERLFEPFYTTKMNGTGLGLALCLSIVERHNGKIHVESAVGQGTTFIVSFCKPGCDCW